VLARDAGAAVPDRDCDRRAGVPADDGDPAPRLAVLGGVVDEVHERLHEQRRVRADPQVALAVQLDPDPLRLEDAVGGLERLLDDPAQRGVLEGDLAALGLALDAGEVEQVLDDGRAAGRRSSS